MQPVYPSDAMFSADRQPAHSCGKNERHTVYSNESTRLELPHRLIPMIRVHPVQILAADIQAFAPSDSLTDGAVQLRNRHRVNLHAKQRHCRRKLRQNVATGG